MRVSGSFVEKARNFPSSGEKAASRTSFPASSSKRKSGSPDSRWKFFTPFSSSVSLSFCFCFWGISKFPFQRETPFFSCEVFSFVEKKSARNEKRRRRRKKKSQLKFASTIKAQNNHFSPNSSVLISFFSHLLGLFVVPSKFSDLGNQFGASLVPQLPSKSELVSAAKKSLAQLPNLIKRRSVTCSKCKTHFSEAPADWKCNKCNELMWIPDSSNCEICNKSFASVPRNHTRCCGKCVCADCIFEFKIVSNDKYFCESCVIRSITLPRLESHFNTMKLRFGDALQRACDAKFQSACSMKSSLLIEGLSKLGFVVLEETLDENDYQLELCLSRFEMQAAAANSLILHLRWLAELCVAEGALDCFKFIEEKHPEALFGVFKEQDLKFANSQILSPALARALDYLDHPSVAACVEYIINKYNVEVQLEDAIRLNSLVGVTRAIKKMEKENFSLDASVRKDNERGKNIKWLFSEAIVKRHFDVVAAMLRCRRDQEGRFLWCLEDQSHALLFRFKYIFPQDLQFRVWCEEKNDFETHSLSDLAQLLQIDLSSNMKCEKFEVWLSPMEQHLWFPLFHLFEEVVHRDNNFSFTPSACPGQLRALDLCGNYNFTDEGVAALVAKSCELEQINLSGDNTQFTDASLRAIAASPCVATLKILHLSDSKYFTDGGFEALVSKCSKLKEIYLSGRSRSKFTDASLKALAASPSVTQQKPPSLVKIDLYWNENLTDSGIDALKKAYGDFWSKVEVNTRNCNNIKNK